jgi:hypothetical protein
MTKWLEDKCEECIFDPYSNMPCESCIFDSYPDEDSKSLISHLGLSMAENVQLFSDKVKKIGDTVWIPCGVKPGKYT